MYTRVSTTHRPTLINHRRSKIILYELREKKEAEFNKNNKVKCHNNAILFKKKIRVCHKEKVQGILINTIS